MEKIIVTIERALSVIILTMIFALFGTGFWILAITILTIYFFFANNNGKNWRSMINYITEVTGI